MHSIINLMYLSHSVYEKWRRVLHNLFLFILCGNRLALIDINRFRIQLWDCEQLLTIHMGFQWLAMTCSSPWILIKPHINNVLLCYSILINTWNVFHLDNCFSFENISSFKFHINSSFSFQFSVCYSFFLHTLLWQTKNEIFYFLFARYWNV